MSKSIGMFTGRVVFSLFILLLGSEFEYQELAAAQTAQKMRKAMHFVMLTR